MMQTTRRSCAHFACSRICDDGPQKHIPRLRSGRRSVMNFLTIRNPWEILVAYLIAVLAFACVYSFFLARDFYHPYVKFEPVVQAQRVRLERTLDDAIATALDRSPDGTGVKFQRTRGAVIIRGGQETTSREALSASYSFAMSLSRGDEQGRLFLVTIPILISPFGLKTYFRSPVGPRRRRAGDCLYCERSSTAYRL